MTPNLHVAIRLFAVGFCLLAATVLLPAAAIAQDGASSPPNPKKVDAQVSGEKLALEQGSQALADGENIIAAGHFLYALSRTARVDTLHELLLKNAMDHPDEFALWALDNCYLHIRSDGKLQLPGFVRTLLDGAAMTHPQELAKARAKAIQEIQKQITKLEKSRKAGNQIAVEWWQDFARAIASPSPGLRKSVRDLDALIPCGPREWNPVLTALKKSANSSINSAQYTDAIRAARVLRGLAAQVGFEDDLKGPRPASLSGEASVANAVLGRARAGLARQNELVYTIEQLENMSIDEQRALTVDRASFGKPSVCYSPRGWYRVETSCGWETLLGTAKTVEYHHDRLVNWYGRDPFIDRPGIVRIVPEAHGLESEGTPFWWAGGFQGGDTTVLKFTMSTIPGLGRGLTHELTHRFDGGSFGGLPGWLGEGRASWTGGAYGSMKEKNFVPNHCSFGTQGGTIGLGYGRQEEFEKLVAGTMEEYRDNYTAGYSLFVYLNTWSGSVDVDLSAEEIEEGPTDAMTADFGKKELYHDRLQSFMKERRRLGNDPVKVFVYYFADGKNGRPDGMQEFVRRWNIWLHGFGLKEKPEWTARYTQSVPGGDPSPMVYDEPTWTWLRNRAEPWFGQDHARQAAELFADLGKHEEAIEAFTWCLGVDEPSISTQLRFADELRLAGNVEAAWMMMHWPRFHAGGVREFLNSEAYSALTEHANLSAPFVRKFPALRALMELQKQTADEYLASERPQAASAVWAEHNEIATWLGLPVVGAGSAEESDLHPFDPAWRMVTFDGWSEPDLTGHEDDRISGLWLDDQGGDLHVGRRDARGGTGNFDRTSHQRNAVVFSEPWFDAGRYQLRAQVEQTTAYLSAGLVFGWTRRDRNVRLGFSMGDWAYAAGADKELEKINGLHWSLDGLYARRGAQRGSHTFGNDRHHFDMLIDVDGPTAEVYFDGILCATYSTLDGSAIHGRIGFYTTVGAMKVSHPEVRRLSRSQYQPGARAVGDGLHPFQPGADDWRDLLGRPVRGVPLAPSGTVLLWFPEQTEDKLDSMEDGEWFERVADGLDRILDIIEPEFPSQGMLVMVPASFSEADRQRLETGFADVLPGGFAVRVHDRPETLQQDQRTVQGWTLPVLGYVDPTGYLRYARRQSRFSNLIPNDLRMMLVKHRDHSRPGTAGAGD